MLSRINAGEKTWEDISNARMRSDLCRLKADFERHRCVVRWHSQRMKRPKSSGTSSTGVHHVAKITSAANCIFHPIAQENDLGLDAYIEFIVDQEATGCCIGVQIKSGESYVRRDQFTMPCTKSHNAYWRSHVLPIAGILYDPKTESARWVDITECLKNRNDGESFSLTAHAVFDGNGFAAFQNHFLTYRKRYSDDAHFTRSLQSLSHVDKVPDCSSGINSMFSFHRNRPETWFFLLSCLRYFRGSPLLRNLVVALCHVPGHPDIFWGTKNIISNETSRIAEEMFRKFLSRDDVLTLLTAIDDETGFNRGSMGQCVQSIVLIMPQCINVLESIAGDILVPETQRFWAALLLVADLQWKEIDRLKFILSRIILTFLEDNEERLASILQTLNRGERIDFS
jgi:hypothetical protein